MKFYKFCLHKAYFDKGFAFFNYLKYPLFLIGLGDILATGGEWNRVAIAGIFVGILCYFMGKWAYTSKYVAAEHEVQNRINPFTKEVRNRLKTKSLNS